MQVQTNRVLNIAYGVNRKTKKWKNVPTAWDELCDKLSSPVYTNETVAQYRALSRDQQSEIKDVGGFVGGYCDKGKRSDCSSRSLVTLDADFADGQLWPDWVSKYGCEAVAYSTHKHTPESMRLRLVIPLARDVGPEEYGAISRRIAKDLGIDKFDDTTYQVQRLMYFGSCSSDGEWVFKHSQGPMLDPDEVLATYRDWRDISAWPMSSRVADISVRAAKEQKDPLSKPGIVGAFCRAYTIREAIERFVPDYVPCEDGRYTYEGGSTAAGVVVYDDKFSYSHHATDPASSELCNAWDLVRLHRFGELDQNCNADTPSSKRPSYRAMAELATKDDRVKLQILRDRQAEADAFDVLPDEDDGWKAKLKITDKGTIAQTIDNAVTILQNDPRLAGAIAMNDMDHTIVVLRPVPWAKGRDRPWVDSDDAGLRHYLEVAYALTSKDKIYDAVNIAAEENRFHPVREYLNALQWDGVPRVETVLIDYLGAQDSKYTRAVTRKALVAAVARVMRPGAKFDYMLTIHGRQGIGKSALIAKLGGPWFSDSFTTLQGKDSYEQVQGVWIMEVGELAGMRKAEVESIKLYISKCTDRFRPAYGRRMQDFPRQCIFIGTTNEGQFLRDATGNRRFWIVDMPNQPRLDMWDDLDADTVGLIWAEALELYRRGEELYLSRELEAMAREVQEEYTEENPKAGLIQNYLDRLLPDAWDGMTIQDRRAWLDMDGSGTRRRDVVCTVEIWAEALGGNPERMDRYAAKEIREIMANMPGWVRSADRCYVSGYGQQRCYRRRKHGAD